MFEQWRPMRTAPRDGLAGSRIRLKFKGAIHIGQWNEKYGWCVEYWTPPGAKPPRLDHEEPDGWLPLVNWEIY